jgi:transposase
LGFIRRGLRDLFSNLSRSTSLSIFLFIEDMNILWTIDHTTVDNNARKHKSSFFGFR